MLEQLLSNKNLGSEEITKLLCFLLLGIVEGTQDENDEFPEVTFPDSILSIVLDILGEDVWNNLQNKILIDDEIIGEVINNTEWIDDETQPDAFEFIKNNLKQLKIYRW